MKTVRFGIVGLGLMGREFASAAARWCHLPDMQVRPEIVAICNRSAAKFDWFTDNFPSITQVTHDYRELLTNPDVDVVYIAVPHDLHEPMYCDTIRAGKHLMGEKPFGIDQAANDAIRACMAQHPNVFVRCVTQFAFYPPVQRIGAMIDAGDFGRLIEVNAGFLHCSDLNPDKPINWKRTLAHNGAYGCMGDLGMHICHIPFRAGWRPRNVRAVLGDIITERPDGSGGMAPCETWDNATLLCETADTDGRTFPMTLKTFRIAPGHTNSWYLEIVGTRGGARFSTRSPKRLDLFRYDGGEQRWQHADVGHEMAFKSITGGIFGASFSEVFMQMWAAFLTELTGSRVPNRFAACATADETALSHRLFTAALQSQETAGTVAVGGV